MKFSILIGCFLIAIGLSNCQKGESNEEVGMEEQEQVVDSATIRSAAIFAQHCSSCHGQQMEAFADRKWLHGKELDSIKVSITEGYAEAGMPAWSALLDSQQIGELAQYIRTGIENVERYGFTEETLDSDTFELEDITVHLDTVFSGIKSPWHMNWLPNGDMLVAAKEGELHRVGQDGQSVQITGLPVIKSKGQGGLFEIQLHPDFEANGKVYLVYTGLKVTDGDSLGTTVVSQFDFADDKLSNEKIFFEARPYTKRNHHFGGRIVIKDNFLFVTVGDRGDRDVNPQDLSLAGGKIHRFNLDGSIPEDNPFYNQADAIKSIWSYGHRNPQGLTLRPGTDELWSHEHGPRGGDEINIVKRGLNYGWPVVSYGINYDATIFTSELEREGMESPVLYWVPSIAPCGMDWVASDKYGNWKGNLLVGSLRFKYLDRCEIENGKVVKEENILKGIGRLRNVEQGPDGYIYVSVENPGYVFRLMPIPSM
ncbi:PQQ-dependent sugar dehydrogenase [Flammeovirgaceae bacterium SG7u.132]|nr:PQQ-dependent sugar dehydrogenase [Flammeovirgaceae bacterium SG7u.132]